MLFFKVVRNKHLLLDDRTNQKMILNVEVTCVNAKASLCLDKREVSGSSLSAAQYS